MAALRLSGLRGWGKMRTMPADPRWTAALRRLDRLRAGPVVVAGLVAGGLAGAFVAVSPHPAALVAFAAVLGLATVLALSAEPLAADVKPRGPQAGDERIHPRDGTELVYVPVGEYGLGAEDLEDLVVGEIGKEQAAEWAGPSKPAHRVRLSGFWIARHPVTNAQYRAFLAAEEGGREPEYWQDGRFNDDRQPVVGVSWDEARAYCRWAGLELPSEAQWEAAARGGDGRRYPWGDEPPDETRACFGQGWKDGRPDPVGEHPGGAGPYGTGDQAGNVWEWCLDAWDPKAYEGRDGQTDPVITEGEGGLRVLRGGSWGSPAGSLAAAVRLGDRPSDRNRSVGFRCVLPVPAEP